MKKLVVGAVLAFGMLMGNKGTASEPDFRTRFRFRVVFDGVSFITDDVTKSGPVKQIPATFPWKCDKIPVGAVGGEFSAGYECRHTSGAWSIIRATCEAEEEDTDFSKAAMGDGKIFVVIDVGCITEPNPNAKSAVKPIEQSL